MNKRTYGALTAIVFTVSLSGTSRLASSVQGRSGAAAASVPIVLDHNRMLIDGEIQKNGGLWRKVRLWVDSGNPDFMMSEALAKDLGYDLSAKAAPIKGEIPPLEVAPPAGVRVGKMTLNFAGVKSQVLFEPKWLFDTMHIDANLPSTVLKRYQVVFDYPANALIISEPGSLAPRGVRASAAIGPKTGIVQIDAAIEGENLSFALDNGASYSFVSEAVLKRLIRDHPEWPVHSGALGCANIWGWWPKEDSWPLIRAPRIRWGSADLTDVGLVGVPRVAEWYSQKTARPVDGFLGANALRAFRVEIDYENSAVYFEKGEKIDPHDMDLVGLTLRLEDDGGYRIIGVARTDGRSEVEGVEPGDRLLQVEDLKTAGATMGAVVDALRGRPGDTRLLILERGGKQFAAKAVVKRFL